jgi:hypothetical protein
MSDCLAHAVFARHIEGKGMNIGPFGRKLGRRFPESNLIARIEHYGRTCAS